MGVAGSQCWYGYIFLSLLSLTSIFKAGGRDYNLEKDEISTEGETDGERYMQKQGEQHFDQVAREVEVVSVKVPSSSLLSVLTQSTPSEGGYLSPGSGVVDHTVGLGRR